MVQPIEDAGTFGEEMMRTGLASAAALSKGAQAIAAEAADYARQSCEAGSAAMERLLSTTTVDKALEIQADHARRSYAAFVAEATRIGGLYADMARDAYKPFEAVVARAG